jgi:hypothetical protein
MKASRRSVDNRSIIILRPPRLSSYAQPRSRLAKWKYKFPCPIRNCACGFGLQKNLNRHFRLSQGNEHQEEALRLSRKTCQSCQKRFSRPDDRVRHENKFHADLVTIPYEELLAPLNLSNLNIEPSCERLIRFRKLRAKFPGPPDQF